MAEDKIWDTEIAKMVMCSDFLLQKYKKTFKNGRTKGSPYEALVFGKVLRLSQGIYKYCSISKERMAIELGCSYETVLSAFKKLEKDGYVFEVPHSKYDYNIVTKAFQVDIRKLYDDIIKQEIHEKENGIGYENDPKRKMIKRWKDKKEEK